MPGVIDLSKSIRSGPSWFSITNQHQPLTTGSNVNDLLNDPLASLESKISRSETVVDVGAGLGYLGEELSRRGFQVIALEASRSHVAGAGRRKARIAGHQFETHQVVVEDSQECRDLLTALVPINSCLVREQTGPPRCRGLFRGIASPAVLCHKEPARASKAPY